MWKKMVFGDDKERPSSKLVDEEDAMVLADNRKPPGWRAMPYILGNGIFERLGTFGLVANFMVYLQREYHMDEVQAATVINTWSGSSNLLPVLGGLISDAFIGRFKSIAFGSFASLLGMLILTLTAAVPQLRPPQCREELQLQGYCISYTDAQLFILLLGLFWLTIGTGGIRPCSIPFGVDQFDSTTDEGIKGISSFYNLYYTTFTIVLLISSTIVVYIQNDVSWTWGFLIPTFCMVFSIVLFFVGAKIYIYVKPERTVLSGIVQVFVAAYKKRGLKLPDDGALNVGFYDPSLKAIVASKLPLTSQYRFLNKAAVIEDEVLPDSSCANEWRLCSIQQVEEVKCLINLIFVAIPSVIAYIPMNQQSTFTVSQGLKMDLHLGPNFRVPAGSLFIISLMTIAVWLPFYDQVLVPILKRVTKQEGGFTVLQRIGIGNLFAILSMIVSAMVERKRRVLAVLHDGVAPMSAMWLTPQLICNGLCEAFGFVGLTELCNSQVPDHMKSIGNSVFYLTLGLSGYASSLLITIVQANSNWLTEDINTSKLDYLYILIAGLGLVNFICYLYCASCYRYKGSVKP